MPGKIAYLEGLRGLAALQVMVMHYLTFFLPSPYCTPYLICWQDHLMKKNLFFLFDGYAAVGLFFVLSGYVLSLTYRKGSSGFFRTAASRWLRLQIPAAVSILLAFLLLQAFPVAYLEAAKINGSSSWAETFDLAKADGGVAIKEIFLKTLLVGYQSTTLWGFWGRESFSDFSLNLPIWSLHIEFWGSLIVLFLARLRLHATALHDMAFALLSVLFFFSPVMLFLIGHFLALWTNQPSSTSKIRRGGGVVALLGGLWLYATRENIPGADIWHTFLLYREFRTQSLFHFVGYGGAALIFTGIFLFDPLQKILRLPPFVFIGKISFGLYLLHMPLLLLLISPLQPPLAILFGARPSAIATAVLAIGVSFAGAILFTRFVDGPTLRLCKKMREKGSVT